MPMSTRRLLSITALLSAEILACSAPTRPVQLASVDSRPAAPAVRFSGRIPLDRPRSSGREDLDGDGAEDCWAARWEGGSGAGGVLLELRAPCSAPPLAIDTTSSFDSFLSRVELPPAFTARPRLVEGVVDLLFGRSHLRRMGSIDGSLQWLLEHQLTAAGTAAAPFAETRRYRPTWAPGTPVLPPSQVVIVAEHPPEPPGGPRAMLVYYAHNHGAFVPAADCGPLSAATTRHGVAVHDRARNSWSWIYISTEVAKLRRPSIGRVSCVGDLFVIEHDLDGPVELVVVSPRTGQSGRIPVESGYQMETGGVIIDGTSYSTAELTEALRRSSSP